MDLGIAGKRALVTGSSDGIGQAIATALAAEGCRVVVHGRNREKTEAVAKGITGETALAIGDLTDPVAADQAIEQALAAFGGIDILVNNAGWFTPAPWEQADIDHWQQVLDANLLSAVRVIRALLEPMKENGWGRIVNMSSGVSINPSGRGHAYAAAKAGLTNLSVGLSKTLAGTGITVNAISPAVVATPKVQAGARGLAAMLGVPEDAPWPDFHDAIRDRNWPNPSHRLATVEDVADLCCFLCSDKAGYLNGGHFRVDGGGIGTVS